VFSFSHIFFLHFHIIFFSPHKQEKTEKQKERDTQWMMIFSL